MEAEKTFEKDLCLDSGLGGSIESAEYCVSEGLNQPHISSNVTEDDASYLFQQDADGDSYLHIVICNGEVEKCLNLISHATSVSQLNLINCSGQTPLLLAVKCQLPMVVRCLIDRGVDLDAVDYGTMNNMVHMAAENKDCDMLKTIYTQTTFFTRKTIESLISLKDQRNVEGFTPLHIAVDNKDINFIWMLMQIPVDVEIQDIKSGYTALHHAVLTGSSQLVKIFIDFSRPYVDSVSYSNQTAYSVAVSNGATKIQEVLIAAGATTDIES